MKKLYIFDFDHTLVNSPGRVRLIKTDGSIEVLTQHEYYDYRLQPGEKIDLSDYDEVIDPEIYNKNMRLLKQHIDNAVVLTARSHSEPVIKFFNSIGINVPVHAVGVNEPKIDCVLPNAQRKKQWIKNAILKNGYDYVEFWDDNHYNIESANELKKELPNVTIITHLVD